MKLMSTVALIGCMLIAYLAYGSDKHKRAPLPEKILSAKSVYIENQTGFQEAADHCYEALAKWGRYAVVTEKNKADIVFVLNGGRENHGAMAMPSGNGVLVADLKRSITTLLVVDAASGDTLWQDTMHAPHGSRAGSLVDELHKRIDEDTDHTLKK